MDSILSALTSEITWTLLVAFIAMFGTAYIRLKETAKYRRDDWVYAETERTLDGMNAMGTGVFFFVITCIVMQNLVVPLF